jgi:hypothetical protein
MRAPVSCGSKNPLVSFVARVAININLDIEYIRSALRRLACALNQQTVLLLVLGITALPMAACGGGGGGGGGGGSNASNNSGSGEAYFDDTHEILQSGIDIRVVSGPFGYDEYNYSERANGERLALDARNASFIVANSQNSNPTSDSDCETGSLPVNEYPFKVNDPDMTWVVGGIFNGEIPQESDWEPSYCNSAAILFRDAPNCAVDGLRITSAWDAIRPGAGSPNLTVKNSWISNVRDDAVENDAFLPLVFEDNLVDGTFQGISVDSGGDFSTQSSETIELYGNVIRIREYLYKGKQTYGALFKNEDESPTSIIYDTVVAVDYNGGSTFDSYWDRSWSKIEDCSNNLFLWLSDQPVPSSQPLPPACFTVLTGAEARAEWARAKSNWIDCHPKVARTPDDPVSNPEQCVANTFGGYSRQ